MGLIAGVISRPTIYALRRGAARDLAQVSSSKRNGHADTYAAVALGHSRSALDRGTTDIHTGNHTVNSLQDRIEAAGEGSGYRDRLALFATMNLYKKRRLGLGEVEQYCQENGLDYEDEKSRSKATRKIHTAQDDGWLWSEKNRRVEPGKQLNQETTISNTEDSEDEVSTVVAILQESANDLGAKED